MPKQLAEPVEGTLADLVDNECFVCGRYVNPYKAFWFGPGANPEGFTYSPKLPAHPACIPMTPLGEVAVDQLAIEYHRRIIDLVGLPRKLVR